MYVFHITQVGCTTTFGHGVSSWWTFSTLIYSPSYHHIILIRDNQRIYAKLFTIPYDRCQGIKRTRDKPQKDQENGNRYAYVADTFALLLHLCKFKLQCCVVWLVYNTSHCRCRLHRWLPMEAYTLRFVFDFLNWTNKISTKQFEKTVFVFFFIVSNELQPPRLNGEGERWNLRNIVFVCERERRRKYARRQQLYWRRFLIKKFQSITFFLLYVTNKKEINCEIKKSSLLSTN